MSVRGRSGVVGISSRSSRKDLEWLMMFIGGTFREYVSDVKYLQITDTNMVKWKKKVKRCSVVILYHTRRQGQINITDVDGALYEEELRSISHTLGKNKVLVVLDDLEDCSEFEKQRILDRQPSLRRLSSQLLLFPKTNKIAEADKKKAEFLKVFGKYTIIKDLHVDVPISGFQESGDMFSESRQNFPWKEEFEQPIETSLKISIFSRSAPSNYEWLVNWLKTTCMVETDNIRAVCISNNSLRFYTELPNCTFAILYHTLKQGALNITDSYSSLYDEELKELYKHLGKENVIVVVDDLPNTNSTEKKRILTSQPSIGRLARDLYLINEKKNNTENLENLKKVIMQEPQSEEFLEPDPEDDLEEPSNAYTVYSRENIYVDVNEDIEPTSSRRSLTKFSNKYDSSAAHILTWKSSDHSEGLKTGTMYPEPTIWSHRRSIQEPQSEEFLEPDPEDDLEESSTASTAYSCENIDMDITEDIEPTSSGRSLTKFSNKYDSSAAHILTWKSSDHSEGLKTGTMYPEPTIWSHRRSMAAEKVDISLQDELAGASFHSAKQQNYMQKMEEEFREMRQQYKLQSENCGNRRNSAIVPTDESDEKDTKDQVLERRSMPPVSIPKADKDVCKKSQAIDNDRDKMQKMEQIIEELKTKLNEKE